VAVKLLSAFKVANTGSAPVEPTKSCPLVPTVKAANSGVKMIVGITALLIAILGLVALADLLLSMVGPKINMFFHINLNWSLKGLLGYIFYPFYTYIRHPKGRCRRDIRYYSGTNDSHRGCGI